MASQLTTRLWSVNLGPNIRAGQHYTQFLVYDFDGDGCAEMICKTAPWTKDGQGNFVSAAADDEAINGVNNGTSYRNSNGHITQGPEFLTVFNGQTGAAMHTIWYNPDRACGINAKNLNPTYGDWEKVLGKSTNYNRGERYNACVAHLDGVGANASAIFNRGYYTMAYFWAVDYTGGKLVHRWLHASVSDTKVEVYDAAWNKTEYTYSSNTCGKGSHYTAFGNGNHNISVGDYDGDGCDEITFGSAAIDNDGKLMYSVGFGHGDAIHVAQMIPSRPGFQVFHVHEEKISGNAYGWDLHDAKTGEVLFSSEADGDNGRGIAGLFIPAHENYVFASAKDRQQRSALTGDVVTTKSAPLNFRIYWNGLLQDCHADGGYEEPYTIKWWTGSSFDGSTTLDGQSCNTTKRVPNLSCDLFGDWREEVILHDGDHTLYIHSSAMPTEYKVPCLLTDHTYRMGIAWQMSSYNQPPHLGYYLPEASTTIKVNASDETLFYDPATIGGEGVQHTEVGSGDITWALTSGTDVKDETPTYASTLENAFSGSSITLGSKISAIGTKNNSAGQTHTQFQPTEKVSAAGDDNAINIMVTLKDGYEFQPTKVSVNSSRWGTNGGSVDLSWVNGDGSVNKLLTGQTPERSADESNGTSHSPYYTNISKTITNAKATTGTFGVRLNVYGIDTNKQISFANLIVEGKLYSTDPSGLRHVSDVRLTAGPRYTLQGTQASPSAKGIYIQDGRKHVPR